MNALGNIHVEGNETIGRALHSKVLHVPANQRDYAWEKRHVTDLYTDMTDVITGTGGEYFLGTIVVIKDATDNNKLFVVDGQQRLATSAILIAAIRDYLQSHSAASRASALEAKFLVSADENLDEPSPHLHLNAGDQAYFFSRILLQASDPRRQAAQPTRPSHKLIDGAAKLAANQVEKVAGLVAPEKQVEQVLRWSNFLYDFARVIWVTVPDDRAAYIVFETMNDRGLELSATDLIKNYLFGKVAAPPANYFEQVKLEWNQMKGIIEGSREPDILKDYVRHYWVAFHAHTRHPELFNRVKLYATSPNLAAQLTSDLLASSAIYTTLLNPLHPDWTRLKSPRTQRNVQTLYELGMKQIRPLLLAVLKHFESKDTIVALRLAVSWVVRFLITGEAGSGALESYYGDAAREIASGKIKTAKVLAEKMIGIVPQDDQFKAVFSTATVAKSDLARYYLRALELTKRNEPEPENIPNDDGEVITLEHVLPENPKEGEWANFTKEEHAQFWRRIGNQALLKKTLNSDLGNVEFALKCPALKDAGFELTQIIGQKTSWGKGDINERQQQLAELAIKTWSIKPLTSERERVAKLPLVSRVLLSTRQSTYDRVIVSCRRPALARIPIGITSTLVLASRRGAYHAGVVPAIAYADKGSAGGSV